jgi:predicted dehydrogenase
MKNGKYLVGMIGTGGIAGTHMRGWKTIEDAELYAAADISEKARIKSAEEFEIPNIYENYKDLLKREEVDIIDICTPNSFHFPLTIDALQAGKHVICEKPLALTVDQVSTMMEESRKAGKKLMAAQHQRFSKESKIIKKLIDDGVFGEIYYAVANALRRRGVPEKLTFIKKELSGGGPMFDIGVHILDLTYWFMGCPKVKSVEGSVFTKLSDKTQLPGLFGSIWNKEDYNVEDFAAGFIKFTDGRSISLNCSFLANMEKKSDFSTTLFGTEAGMRFPDGKLTTEKNGTLQDIELNFDSIPNVTPHHEELRYFLQAVKEDREVPVKPEESLEVIKMLEGIYKSAETEKV